MEKADVGKPVEKVQQAVKDETVSARIRRQRTALFQVALLATIVAFGMLTFMVKAGPALGWDVQVTRAVQSINAPWFDASMRVVSWAGFPPQSMLFAVLIVLLIYAFGLKWESVATLVAAALPGLVSQLVKLAIRRPRPTADLVHVLSQLKSYSFPSGHVMFYLTFFGFLWFLSFTLLKPSAKRTILLVLFAIPVALVGISRIYEGQHWFSDVLGAYLLGSLTLAACIWFYRWGKKRYFRDQEVAPHEPQVDGK